MIYQVRANLFFADPDEANDFYHDCQLALAKATVVNPNLDNLEYSIAELIDNRHDEDPAAPCSVIYTVDNKPPPPE